MNFMIVFFLMIFIWKFSMAQDINSSINWQEYKQKYLKENSYIIDPYNNRVTSEAQGYGMILALKYNDKEVFDSIYKWTKINLQRQDNLFSWLWNGSVVDKNNATDGDLLIAYGLFKAYKKWKEDYYLQEFNTLNNSLKKLIVNIKIKNDIDTLLLPAVYGFSNEKYEITLFPSYYIEFILKEFSENDKDWKDVYRSLDKIYRLKNISTNIRYPLIEKKFFTSGTSDLDVYRIIAYSYLTGKLNINLKSSFEEIDKFFKKNGYIPFTFKYNSDKQEQRESPFCVYKFFYLLYKDNKYLQKYKDLVKTDKNNYFCDSFELLLEGHLSED
ncbi:MAG: glycosyl hydrolase family 8 [Hydrogenothermaceae bacterium]